MRKIERWSGDSSIATMDALMEAMEKAGLRIREPRTTEEFVAELREALKREGE